MKIFHQLFKQGVVGLSNALLNYAIFIFLVKVISVQYIIANIIAAAFSYFFVFFGQKKFTFKDKSKKHLRQHSLFSIFFFSYTFIESFLLYILKNSFSIDIAYIKVFVVFLLFFYSFFFQKYIVFREEKRIDE